MNTIIIAIIIVAIGILAFVFFSTNNKQKDNKEGSYKEEVPQICNGSGRK